LAQVEALWADLGLRGSDILSGYFELFSDSHESVPAMLNQKQVPLHKKQDHPE
jgi:hypothetical protein